MPQQSSLSLVLDFATVYQCAVKPFKSLPQNRSVCILLFGNVDDGFLPISDAVCSNYVMGKRPIPDDCRTAFAKIKNDGIKAKFEALRIYNLHLPADALRKLINIVQLPKTTYNKLVMSYQTSTPEQFLAEVFHYLAETKGSHPLSSADLALIASFAFPKSENHSSSENSGGDIYKEQFAGLIDQIDEIEAYKAEFHYPPSTALKARLLAMQRNLDKHYFRIKLLISKIAKGLKYL